MYYNSIKILKVVKLWGFEQIFHQSRRFYERDFWTQFGL